MIGGFPIRRFVVAARYWGWVWLLLLLVGSRPGHSQSDQYLWQDISLGPPLLEWFNGVARPDDIARIENIEQLALLEQVTAGRKLVIFKSVAEASQIVPQIADQIDIIGYNLEHAPVTPQAEQDDPVGSVAQLRQLADQYGLFLALGPDRTFALSHGPAMAPYVDIFVLQVQRVQNEPTTVRDFVLPLVPQLRATNPTIAITIQLRTEGDVTYLADLVDSLRGQLDGVSILTSPESVAVAEALVAELQARDPILPTPIPTPLAPTAPTAEPLAPAGTNGNLLIAFLLGVAAGGLGGGLFVWRFAKS